MQLRMRMRMWVWVWMWIRPHRGLALVTGRTMAADGEGTRDRDETVATVATDAAAAAAAAIGARERAEGVLHPPSAKTSNGG